jgi:uncharacterized protein (TIGR03086 family)
VEHDSLDPRPLYRDATAWVDRMMSRVRADQLGGPTPCPGFDVRALLGHLVGTAERSLATATGRSPRRIPHVVTDIDDDVHAVRYAAAAAAAHRAWAARSRLDDPVAAPWGEVSGRDAVWGFANETLVHGWDLAVATGQPSETAAALVEPVLARARTLVPRDTRTPRGYGPAVASGTGAGLTESLANWHGHRWPAA